MKIKSVTLKYSDHPIPVYDATSPKYHNLTLANGCVVHNTAKLARDRTFQATFSLKGKPLNVMDVTKDKVNANAEIAGIFAGIGLDLSADDPISKIRFGRVIWLADPDVDGRHINTLLHVLFYTYLPDLYKQGRIFMIVTPEYIAKQKGKILVGATKEEIYKQAGTDKIEIRHIKGWGEISAEDMQPIAFTKGTRRMYRVLPPIDKSGVARFKALMGKNPEYRKKLLGVV